MSTMREIKRGWNRQVKAAKQHGLEIKAETLRLEKKREEKEQRSGSYLYGLWVSFLLICLIGAIFGIRIWYRVTYGF